MKALVKTFLLLLLVFAFTTLAAQKAPRLERVLRTDDPGKVVTFGPDGKPETDYPAIQTFIPSRAESYPIGELVLHNGDVYEATAATTATPPGVDWVERFTSIVDSTRLDTSGSYYILKYWTDGVLVVEDTLPGKVEITQIDHGFEKNDVVAYYDGYYSYADFSYTQNFGGIICDVIDDNTFTVLHKGNVLNDAPEILHKGFFSGSGEKLGEGRSLLQRSGSAECDYYQGTNGKIYWWGNSITNGSASSSDALRFTSLTTAALNGVESNNGVGGMTMQNTVSSITGLETTNSFITALRAGNEVQRWTGSRNDLFVLSLGTNDFRRDIGGNFTIQTFASAYREALDSLTGPFLWPPGSIKMISIHYMGSPGYQRAVLGGGTLTAADRDRHHEFNDTIRALATEYGIQYIDTYSAMAAQGDVSLISSDDVHPTDEGHAVIANAVISTLQGCYTSELEDDPISVVEQSDAQPYIDSAATLSADEKIRIHYLVGELIGAGIWDKMLVAWPFRGGTRETHKWNLKDPSIDEIFDFRNSISTEFNLEGGDNGTRTGFLMFDRLTDPNKFSVYTFIDQNTRDNGILWGVRGNNTATSEVFFGDNRNDGSIFSGFGTNNLVGPIIWGGRVLATLGDDDKTIWQNGAIIAQAIGYGEDGVPPTSDKPFWLHSIVTSSPGNARIGFTAIFDKLTDAEALELDRIMDVYENHRNFQYINVQITGAGDNLGDHTATQDLDMGTFAVNWDSGSRFTNTQARVGDGTEAVTIYDSHITFTNQATDPITGAHRLYAKEVLVDGDYKNRPHYRTNGDDVSETFTGTDIFRILTDADVRTEVTRRLDADKNKVAGSIDTEFTLPGLEAESYEIEIYIRYQTNTAGGGIAWNSNANPANSGFILDTGAEGDWTVGTIENATAANVWNVMSYKGVITHTGAASFTLSTGPNGTGDLTIGAGSFVRATRTIAD